ncbi:MAG TPA: mechanosensitive ion channel domain-containing protein [Desulfuromonadales bacterium]|nr:mechanosensitive ion channel domain-containing protein [Desulfuromonadales bacterium]
MFKIAVKMRKALLLSILSVFLLLRLATSPLFGQESPAQSQAPYPGVAEVVPRASQLAEEGLLARERIATLSDTATVRGQLDATLQQLIRMEPQLTDVSEPLARGFDEMRELRGRLADEKGNLENNLDRLSARLSELEEMGKSWRAKKAFWESWQTSLQGPEIRVPLEEFQQAIGTIDDVLRSASIASERLVQLQKDTADLQGKTVDMLSRIESLIRGQTFSKVSHSFASREYLQQFDARLWSQVRSGIAGVEGISPGFLRDQGWIAVLQILLVFILAGFIIHHRPRAEETEEWQFILHHPWATGIFVAFSTLSLLYSEAPDLWQLLLWLPAAFSATILMCALLKNPRKRFTIWLLATFFVLSLALRTIALPLPLYRLYLALLSLVGVPLFLLLAASNQRARQGQLTGFTVTLRIGAAVLLAAFLAQFAGYSTLSFRLIESSLKTVILGLFAFMTVKLGQGAIDFILDQQFFRRWRFFRRFGSELTTRLKNVFLALIVAFTSLYLLEAWYIFDSLAEAWSKLLSLSLTIAEVSISVEKVLVVGLVLYLSIIASWTIRNILEAEFFPRRRFDRGVRDAIKKLLHYSLVLIGFLLAMSLVGVELKNFAVLAGAFGIGIGFGLQNIVNNFVSGLILLFERPIKVGDMIVVDNEWGTVRKIGLRSTVVTTLEESEIIVPNSVLVAEKVTNWSLTSTLCRVAIPVGVAYGSDVPLVLRILVEAGKENAAVLDDPEPSPLFRGFGDSSLDFELRVWISDVRDRFRVRSEICQYIDRRFREEGVEIPFPQRDLHLRSVDAEVIRDLGNQPPGKNSAPSSRFISTGEKGKDKRPAQKIATGRAKNGASRED